MIIDEICVIPDKEFKKKGILVIDLNTSEIFSSKNTGDWEDVAQSIIRIVDGKEILPHKTIDLYFWNGTDATEIGLTSQITFGE